MARKGVQHLEAEEARRLAAADSAGAAIRGEQVAAAARLAELEERLKVERVHCGYEALAVSPVSSVAPARELSMTPDRIRRINLIP